MIFWGATSFLIALSGAVAPGPLGVFALTSGARSGPYAGWWVACGHAVIEGALLLVISMGIGESLQHFSAGPVFLLVSSLVFLLYGTLLLRKAGKSGLSSLPRNTSEDQLPINETHAAWKEAGLLAAQGAWITLINPYWLLWWATIGSVAAARAAAASMQNLLAFYLGHIAADFVWLVFLSMLAAGGKSRWGDRFSMPLQRLLAVIMMAFGVSFGIQAFGSM